MDSGEVDYAVVPFENSTNGQVVFTYDLIRDWFISKTPNFKIVAEQFVAIHHNFISRALSIDEITTVYSHPQVWTQVSKFLQGLGPNVKRIDCNSTSAAAEMVYNDKTNVVACISSKMSSELYLLPILQEGVEDIAGNTTRFLILGLVAPPPPPGGKDESDYITSIIFTIKDHPGSLWDALDPFKRRNINLTCINSRPSHDAAWEYVFFLELIGNHDTDSNVKEGILEMAANCTEVVVVGSFKRSWRYSSK